MQIIWSLIQKGMEIREAKGLESYEQWKTKVVQGQIQNCPCFASSAAWSLEQGNCNWRYQTSTKQYCTGIL